MVRKVHEKKIMAGVFTGINIPYYKIDLKTNIEEADDNIRSCGTDTRKQVCK
jgi:hypothetical protein